MCCRVSSGFGTESLADPLRGVTEKRKKEEGGRECWELWTKFERPRTLRMRERREKVVKMAILKSAIFAAFCLVW